MCVFLCVCVCLYMYLPLCNRSFSKFIKNVSNFNKTIVKLI